MNEKKIAEWLMGSDGLAVPAGSIVHNMTGLEDVSPLKVWATNLLFDPTYKVTNNDLEWVRCRGGDLPASHKIREELTFVGFDTADWAEVARLVRDIEKGK